MSAFFHSAAGFLTSTTPMHETDSADGEGNDLTMEGDFADDESACELSITGSFASAFIALHTRFSSSRFDEILQRSTTMLSTL